MPFSEAISARCKIVRCGELPGDAVYADKLACAKAPPTPNAVAAQRTANFVIIFIISNSSSLEFVFTYVFGAREPLWFDTFLLR